MKRCSKCRCEKPPEDFPKNKLTQDGRGSWCRACCATYSKTPRGKAALARGIKRQQDAGYYRFGKGAIPILKQGAEARGIAFSLSAEALETWWHQAPDACSYCGITTDDYKRLRDFVVSYDGTDYEILKFRRIFRSSKHAAINWLTLDRVDNSRGYELNNLVKCCWFCNSIKGSLLSALDMRVIAKNVIQRLQERIAGASLGSSVMGQ